MLLTPSPLPPSHSRAMASAVNLHPDRFLDPDPAIRRAARELYDATSALPLVCPHGHVDPSILAENSPFPEPTALLIIPDHYIFRMLHSRGVRLEELGIPARDGSVVERDPRKIWQKVADLWYLFRGTPSGAWLAHELHEVFGVRERLEGDSAQHIYDEIAEKLKSPEFLPRNLFEQFRIEMLATTDAAADPLAHHQAIRASDWSYGKNRVVPTFRPDALFRIAAPAWQTEVRALEKVTGTTITSCDALITTLAERRQYFASLGGTATDHAVVEPYTMALAPELVEQLFQRARNGEATADDQRRFEAHMLMEMARLSTEDGLVMQLHPGSLRDHNTAQFTRFGTDKGADIPVAVEFTRNLRSLLNTYGDDPRFSLVIFTLDESTYSRELAPLAGHYPALRLGPPWWFHDSIEGMMRYREQVSETAGIYNTSGFNDDTRAFCSIPARHDLARRMDANWLGGLVARHIVEMDEAREMAQALAVDLVRETYHFPVPAA
ncbi:MAG: Glucuronate isomerase [Gemmatimonadetes bacterium]|nr:Glucuronate isomerase [Gemmatimonadota bacterium]